MDLGTAVQVAAGQGRSWRSWGAVAAGFICLFIADGIGYYSFGVFFNPFLIEFGQTRAATAAIFSVFGIFTALGNVLVGWWMDRRGPRSAMVVGAVVMGACYLLLSTAQHLWQVYLLYGLGALGRAGFAFVPVGGVVSRLFPRRRGLAMGIAMSGVSLGGLTMVPLLGYLILASHWRSAFGVMALLIWTVILPTVLLLIPTRSELDRLASASWREEVSPRSPGRPQGWTLQAALASHTFWIVGLAFALGSLTTSSIAAHLVPYLTDRGISPQEAATVLGSLAGLGIVAKLLSGYLADRFTPRLVLMGCWALEMAGILILMQVSSLSQAWLFVLVFALGQGSIFALQPLLVGGFFGLGAFGSIYGVLTVANTVGGAIGNPLTGHIFDVSGSYFGAFTAFLAANGLAILLLALAPLPRVLGSSPGSGHRGGDQP